MKVLFCILTMCVFSINAAADGADGAGFFREVEFVAVYKTDGSKECVLFAGNESLIEKKKKSLKSSSKYPFQFILITKQGGSVSALINGIDSQLDDSEKIYTDLNGLKVSEIFVRVARGIDPRG